MVTDELATENALFGWNSPETVARESPHCFSNESDMDAYISGKVILRLFLGTGISE